MIEISTSVGQLFTEFANERSENLLTSLPKRNFLCVWCYDINNFDLDLQSEMERRLDESLFDINIYRDSYQYIANLIEYNTSEKLCFVITSKLDECLYTLTTERSSNWKVYQFQPNGSLTNNSHISNNPDQLFSKIAEDFPIDTTNNQSSSTDSQTSTIYRESRLSLQLTFLKSAVIQKSFHYWKKKSPEFFLSQILSQILVKRICDQDGAYEEMFSHCRNEYSIYPNKVQQIDTVERDYRPTDAILHYTKDSFLFRSVGKVFRSEDFEEIFIFRRYIYDLHGEIDEHGREFRNSHETLHLYRGKNLQMPVIEQLKANIGSIISINGFLSTTKRLEVAETLFAGTGGHRPGYVSVIFEFCIDKTKIIRTYADISKLSQFPQEEEVLFSIGSIWRIDSVKKRENELYWIVKLSTCYEIDSDIIKYFKELPEDSALILIGDVLYELQQFTKAENFYRKVIDDSTANNEIRTTLYQKIGVIRLKEGKYAAASDEFEKAEKLMSKEIVDMESQNLQLLSSTNAIALPFHILNNMAVSYFKTGDANNALEYFQQALNLPDEISPKDKAAAHDNMGLIFFSCKQYSKALGHFSEAVNLAQNHSSVSIYNRHHQSATQLLQSQTTTLDQRLSQHP